MHGASILYQQLYFYTYSLIVDLSVGELECIDDVDIDGCVECVAANPTLIVGTKLRLSAQIAKAGENELEALR